MGLVFFPLYDRRTIETSDGVMLLIIEIKSSGVATAVL